MSGLAHDGGTLVVRRLIRASRERVFAAWLNPSTVARFMHPGTARRATAEIDPRVGGAFRIVMHGDKDYDHRGEYLVVDPPSTLSFTWISEGTDQQPSVVTIELFERDDATELVLTHRRLPLRQVQPHTEGWTQIAETLARVLEST